MSEASGQKDDARFAHPLEPYPKLIINAALTGVIPTRAHSPHVPLTPREIIDDAVVCCDAGASIVHVHARDAEGNPAYDPAVFAEIISGIKKRPTLRPFLLPALQLSFAFLS